MNRAASGSLSEREAQFAFAGLMVGMLLPALNINIVATALPAIIGDLGQFSALSWIVGSYLLTFAVSMPIIGKLSDLWGRKTLFELAIVVFVIGSVLCGLAQGLEQLVVFRALQGIGGGGLVALTQTTIGDLFTPRQRGRYQGYLAGIFTVASTAGPVLGGFFVDNLSWRWVFFVNVPLGLGALVIGNRYLPSHRPSRHRNIDYRGGLLLTLGVTSTLLMAMWGGEVYPWFSTVIVALAITTMAALALFIGAERRAVEPILPLTLFRLPVFTVGVLVAFLVQAPFLGAVVFVPVFFQVAAGLGAMDSGFLLLPLAAAMLFSSITSGRLITRSGRYKVFPVIGIGLMTLGFSLLATMKPAVIGEAVVYLAIVGLGVGLTHQVLILVVQNAVAHRDLGAATSGIQLFRMMGATIGIAAMGTLLNARLQGVLPRHIPHEILVSNGGVSGLVDDPAAIGRLRPALQSAVRDGLVDGFGVVFAFAAVVSAVSFVLIWLLKELPLQDPRVAEAPAGTRLS